MKTLKVFAFAICIAAVILALGIPANAQPLNQLTYFTFSAPVEIPGGRVLPAGKYAFTVLDLGGSRNVVQIFNADQTRLLATVLTIPDYRQNPTDKPVIKFSETPQGGPPAIKEWFYPGDDYGQEFVYPKTRAVALAKAANQPVPSMANKMASAIKPTPGAKKASAASIQALKSTPLRAEKPNGQEVAVAEAFVMHPVTVGTANNSPNMKTAKTLPKTGSLLPLFGVAGCSLMFIGALLWVISKRMA
jgi:LPXTG-motif cell wall-anchored protein